jgi:hypothetical protein
MHPASKKTLVVLAIAAMLAIAGFFTLYGLVSTGAASTGRVAALLHRQREAISVPDQAQADRIKVGLTALSEPGYVVIYDDEEGPGKILGVSRRLPKGVTRDLEVPLQQPPAAGWYYAMIRRDDGDGNFDPDKDAPVRDARGAIVMTRFLASTGE